MALRDKLALPKAERALAGRPEAIMPTGEHAALGRSLTGPYPEQHQKALFGLGCFWGAERKFWQLGAGIWITAVGYAGGVTPNPSYQEVCTGRTGHNEVVLVVFDPKAIPYATLLKTFFESHDPTQGMRQGNDIGTQYRSGIYCFDANQESAAQAMYAAYGDALARIGLGRLTTEILPAGPFYFAEEYHQQYLHKNPGGYCGLGGTGIACPILPSDAA